MNPCRPISSSDDVHVGKQYLYLKLARGYLSMELIQVIKKPRKKRGDGVFTVVHVKKSSGATMSEQDEIWAADVNIDGGGYNDHHLFRMSPKNFDHLLDLTLAQDCSEYCRQY